MSRPTHLWFRTVGVVEAFSVLIRKRCRDVEVFAPAISAPARRLLAWAGVTCTIRTPQLGGLDQLGLARTYRSEHRLYLASKAFADGETRTPRHLSTDEFRRFQGSYFIAKNRDAVAFATAVEAEYLGETDIDVVCLLSFPSLGRFAAAQLSRLTRAGFHVAALPCPRAALECVRPFPGSPLHLLSALLRPRREAACVDETARTQGIVLEQGYWRSLSSYPHSGHMYWVEGSGVEPARIALYCNRLDTPAERHLQEQAALHGFGWIDGSEPLRHARSPWRTLCSALADAWAVRPTALDSSAWVRWSIAATSAMAMDAYRQMLDRYNVAAIHHFSEYSPDTLALCFAARRENAITAWNVWSVIPFLIARYNWAVADLILAWGPLDSNFHKVNGFDFRAIAEVGMVAVDVQTPADVDAARTLRQRLAPTVRFVVTAFDNGFGWENHNNETHFRVFLGTLADLMEEHDDWGLVIKPKRPVHPENFPGAWDRLVALSAAGRCLILEQTFSVGVAAEVADLVVGCPMNSAAIASALLRGRRLTQLDMTGLNAQPLFEQGLAHGLVHTDAQSFHTFIERVAADPVGELGSTAPWRDWLDSFNDGEGSRRAGALIGEYLKLRPQHGAVNALAAAITAYAAVQGEKRVVLPDNRQEGPWGRFRAELMGDSEARLTVF